MPPRSPSPAGPDASRRRAGVHEAIIEAAERLLKKMGYGRVTIEAIARESGAGKQTIYRWWPNKGAIFNELYNSLAARTIPPPDLGSCEKEVTEFCFEVHKLWRETAAGPAFAGMVAEAQADPVTMHQWRDDFLPHRREAIRVILRRAQDRGELPKNLDLELATDVCFGFNMYRLLTGRLIASREEARKIAALVVRGWKNLKA
ncbi:MAG: TetR/AcrR family transcriptional regulator [Verrucomicrobiota bacterium]